MTDSILATISAPGGMLAHLTPQGWASDRKVFAERLNILMTRPLSRYYPDRVDGYAHELAKEVGGHVTFIRPFVDKSPAEAVKETTLKHLPGQHDQKRHGWRYGRNPKGPGKDASTADQEAYERHAVTRHGFTADDVRQAKEVMSGARDRLETRLGLYRALQSDEAAAMFGYTKAKEHLNECNSKLRAMEKVYEDKNAPLKEKYDALVQKYHDTGQYKYMSKANDIDSKMYDNKTKVTGTQKYRDSLKEGAEAEQARDTAKLQALRATDEVRYKTATTSAAIEAYQNETESARNILMKVESANGETLRHAAMVKADRETRLATQAGEKASAAYREANEYMNKAGDADTAEGRYHDHYNDPEYQAITTKARAYYESSNAHEAAAKAAFGDSLNQDTPASLSMEAEPMTKIGDEYRQAGLKQFESLVGPQPLMAAATIKLAVNREGEYSRDYFNNGILANVDYGEKIAAQDKKSGSYKYSESDKKTFSDSTIHELGHALEAYDPGVRAEASKFYDKRTAGLTKEPLYGEMKFGNVDLTEYAIKDKFVEPYMGKTYDHGGKSRLSTQDSFGEMISVGLAMFHSDPVKLASKDPEYFNWLYAVVRLNQ